MTRDIVIVVFICVSSGPVTGVAAPNKVSIADQIILAGEKRVNIVTLLDLVVIQLLQITTHSHGSNGIPRVETIELVAGGKHWYHVASCEAISGTSQADKSVYLVGKRRSKVERGRCCCHLTTLDHSPT